MKPFLVSIVCLTMIFAMTVSVRASEFDPLSGLGSDPTQEGDHLHSLDDLTEGGESTTDGSEESALTLDGVATDAAGQEVLAITEQIKNDCSQDQIAAYQPQIDACMGSKDACNSYSSPGCLAEESGDAEGLSIPLSCFFECIAQKLVACKPVFSALLDSCHGATASGSTTSPPTVETGDSVTTTVTAPASECPEEHKIKRGYLCVCSYGYQINRESGVCDFITSDANLDADGIEKVDDMVAAADSDPYGRATTTITVNGKEVTVGVSADPNDYGTYRYTVDGIHYATTLKGAIAPGFFTRVGNGLLDGARRGLSMLSPFNWFTDRYQGDDKEVKYQIGREVVYDDIDFKRHTRLKDLKYMNDFLNGMALYMDLRLQGKTPQQIAGGDQEINAEINHATDRMRLAAIRTDKTFSDEDKARIQADHDAQMYAAFEDGFLRYQLEQKLKGPLQKSLSRRTGSISRQNR